MSAEALLFCFGLPGEDTFPTSIVRNIFGPFIEKKDGNLWYLAFPDGGRCEVFVDEGEQTGSLMFDHAGGDDLFKAIFEIMRQTQTVFVMVFWRRGGGECIGHSAHSTRDDQGCRGADPCPQLQRAEGRDRE